MSLPCDHSRSVLFSFIAMQVSTSRVNCTQYYLLTFQNVSPYPRNSQDHYKAQHMQPHDHALRGT